MSIVTRAKIWYWMAVAQLAMWAAKPLIHLSDREVKKRYGLDDE